MTTLKKALAGMLIALLLPAGACAHAPESPADKEAPNTVTITFDYAKQSGYASNQFAVWIATGDGAHLKTLYATRFTATGGWKDRPDALPDWVLMTKLAGKQKEEIDAITGATPKAGELTYVWDCTDGQGAPVPPGIYQFVVEGSLRWAMHVSFTGEIEIGGGETRAEAAAVFSGEDGAERGMIGNVRAVYMPEA